jgi:hypothetical protein
VRPVAGAIVFAASSSIAEIHPILAMLAGLLIAGGIHAAKAAAIRPAVSATTAGAGNVPVSILEDVISTVLSILAILIPVLVAAIVILSVSLVIWWMWRRANRDSLVQ